MTNDGQKFLKVTSILMIIGGVSAVLVSLAGFAGVALLASAADAHAEMLALYVGLGLGILAAVVELIAGIKGVKAAKTGEKADKCVVWGGIVAGIAVVSVVAKLIGGDFDITSALLNLVLPALYIYGALKTKTGVSA